MKPPAFQYVRPRTLNEALSAIHGDPEAKVLAGGQSLVPLMSLRLSQPTTVVDLAGLPELATIEVSEQQVVIGSMVRHQQILMHEELRQCLPLLPRIAQSIGHWAIRNRGTVGGSLCHADPAAEWPATMAALDAQLILSSLRGTRSVAARDFFRDIFLTDLAADEILLRIEIPIPVSWTFFGFHEISRRHGDFALAGAIVARADKELTGEITWFAIQGKPFIRPLANVPQDAGARRLYWENLLNPVEWTADPEYRRALAITAAERAYSGERRSSQYSSGG